MPKEKVTVKVPSSDPKKKEDLEPKKPEKALVDDNHGPSEESEEDKLLREKLESAATKLIAAKKIDMKVFEKALTTLSTEIKSATASMTSVPKPLKYLRPFYKDLTLFYSKHSKLSSNFKQRLADVLSVLAMTMAEDNSRDMLKYKLLGNREELGVWGHEFVRALCGEISQEYTSPKHSTKADLVKLAYNIAPFLITQNTETEAVDLLFEVEELDFLLTPGLITEHNYERTCLYLTKFSEYLYDFSHFERLLTVTYKLYLNNNDLSKALLTALKLNNSNTNTLVSQVLNTQYSANLLEEKLMKQQLGFILASQRHFSAVTEVSESVESEGVVDAIKNESLTKHFNILAQSLSLTTPKSPEDVYKTHLYGNDNNYGSNQAQSARKNLAATYVNAFVNCAFTKDVLINKPQVTDTTTNTTATADKDKEELNWVFKNKEHGKAAAVASIGLIQLWEHETGLDDLNNWLDKDRQTDPICLAGALLGLGVNACGVAEGADTATSLITYPFEDDSDSRTSHRMVKICGLLGLGIANAGCVSEQASEFLLGVLQDEEEESTQVKAFAALALGLTSVGTGDGDVAGSISEMLFEEAESKDPMLKFAALGLALVYLGKQEGIELQMEALSALEDNPVIAKLAKVLLQSCAYAGSGHVIQVQQLLHLCAQHLNVKGQTQEEAEEEATQQKEQKLKAQAEAKTQEGEGGSGENVEGVEEEKEEKEEVIPTEAEMTAEEKDSAAQNAIHQSAAVLGVALITFGESVGQQMAERSFQHLLQYGDLCIRRAVPLAMALAHVSDPQYSLIDVLSKRTHDADKPTAMCAILALGIMSAGTTNSRVAQLLRQLAAFYEKDPNVLFIVRLSQGLLFTGKGLLTLHPFHSDKSLMSPAAVGGLMTVLLACFDLKNTLLADFHLLLYTLVCAIRPRMCLTLAAVEGDESGKLEHVKVKVRVGQAVETVGQAGNPKKITGFQAQETPVLVNVGDRVELATDEFEPFSSVMEGVVILKRLPKKNIP